MGFISAIVSGLIITLGILIQTIFPEQNIGNFIRNYAGIPVYIVSEFFQRLYNFFNVGLGLLQIL